MDLTLDAKQQQFNAAMDLYEKAPVYQRIYKTVSVANVSLQAYSLSIRKAILKPEEA